MLWVVIVGGLLCLSIFALLSRSATVVTLEDRGSGDTTASNTDQPRAVS